MSPLLQWRRWRELRRCTWRACIAPLPGGALPYLGPVERDPYRAVCPLHGVAVWCARKREAAYWAEVDRLGSEGAVWGDPEALAQCSGFDELGAATLERYLARFRPGGAA